MTERKYLYHFTGPVKVNVSLAILSVAPSQLHYRSYEGMRQEQSFERVDPFTVRMLINIYYTAKFDIIENS